MHWIQGKNRSVADDVQLDILNMLESLAPQIGGHVVMNKNYTLSEFPIYTHTLDSGDKVQIADSQYSNSGWRWTDRDKPVRWAWPNQSLVEITIDLDSVQAIAGVRFSTAGDESGVNWADRILRLRPACTTRTSMVLILC